MRLVECASTLEACLLDLTRAGPDSCSTWLALDLTLAWPDWLDCRWVGGWKGGGGGCLSGVESWKDCRLKMSHPFRTVACRTGPTTAVSVFINYSNSILLFVGGSKAIWKEGARGSFLWQIIISRECALFSALFTSPLRMEMSQSFWGFCQFREASEPVSICIIAVPETYRSKGSS